MRRTACRSTIPSSSRSGPRRSELDLAVVLHTFTVMPPYAPGGLDTWDNLWLQRSAAHPWCGMRNMAALIGSGVMDRYPEPARRHARSRPRLAAVLDGAARRALRDDPRGAAAGPEAQAERIRDERPLFPEHRDARRRAGHQRGDRPRRRRMCSCTPRTIRTAKAISRNPSRSCWAGTMPEERKRKLFWDNAVRLYARCGL